jgi:hypothetical protein
LESSNYVTLVVTVPESHADELRHAMGVAGAVPFLGKVGVLETLIEERIETICKKSKIKKVIEAIKKVHPYEETVIDILPIYDIGYKRRTK